MLATVGTEIPTGDGWVFEPKYDGIRILALAGMSARGPDIALVSRNGLDKTRQFPEVADAVRALRARAKRAFVIDGEIVVMRGESPARFQALQSRMHVNDANAIGTHRTAAPAALMVFDMLVDGKRSLTQESWRERRAHLAALLGSGRAKNAGAIRLSAVSEDGDALLRDARRNDWEGIIAKRTDAAYEVGRRSRAWVKLKIERRQEFVVGGWTEPRKSREHVGAILLGYYDAEGAFVYAGHTGTGFSRQSLADMHRVLQRIERKTSPFTSPPRTNEAAHWTRPSVVVEIKFNEWTTDGKLRQPVFLGVRDDKSPRDVVREQASIAHDAPADHGRARARGSRNVAALAQKTATKTKTTTKTKTKVTHRDAEAVALRLQQIENDGGSGKLQIADGTLDISNLGKVFFPETKQTKGDLLRFYARVAPYILPAIADRPLVMRRFPNGIKGKAFYQHEAPPNPPALVRVEPVSDEGLTTQNYLIGGNLATLLYVIQLGAISIDPWHSRVQSVRFADYSIIDLDPGPSARFDRVVVVAGLVKRALDEFGLHAVPKTSGASGLHVVLPLGAGVPNDGARMIAEIVARRVVAEEPKLATIERSVSSRPRGAVYVDFLQNIRGKTVAGVYSARAEPRATVSTPLRWSEVADGLDPGDFTIDTVLPRIQKLGDLWAMGMKTPNSLTGLIGRG